jgi:hypothetical protein
MPELAQKEVDPSVPLKNNQNHCFLVIHYTISGPHIRTSLTASYINLIFRVAPTLRLFLTIANDLKKVKFAIV